MYALVGSSEYISSLLQGFVEDRRNTDNAWIETIVTGVHDESELFSRIKFNSELVATASYKWVQVSKDTAVNDNDREYLFMVCAPYYDPFKLIGIVGGKEV
jgi:hypothetical protein